MSPEFEVTNAEAKQVVMTRLREYGLPEIPEAKVRVRQGTAYIEGAVPNLRQKKLAEEIASQIDGVRNVVNMLRITPLTVIDDDALKKHITQVLARNPRIDQSKVSVEVMNGVVYLGGFAGSAAEKHLAEREVWAMPGVRDIVNKIEIQSAASKSDMQIVGEILDSLSHCLGLDLSKLAVELKDGTVHLRGTVPSDYMKEAAEELATWTPSVTGVVNELKVLEFPDSGEPPPLRLVESPDRDCMKSNEIHDQEPKLTISGYKTG